MPSICRWDELGDGEARRVEIDGTPVAIIRCGEEVYAIGDTCTHADYSLSEGELDCDDMTIECWKHGSLFSFVDGTALTLPATQPTPVYDVKVTDEGEVVVEES